ncbi:MAG TPA: GTPase Era [Thermodesulfobium narugense]|uniref:GTPase Era n=1 Tax=Thermodesulfobium acidiphilum TaxID=1794699 RepID=A0A2R4W185_THEAF|nr:GTPase Era [Thermodesulfobium acidiphilum]AWB10571.1 GTP-binding protein Era [Thermodesulfobium acidiphilum]PMP86278.1 MAG: GTPase Era [Thermodesulfobium narugense]HEM56261.1 GTPase Era [Thermodesulfobium narugense]
MKSGFAIFVGKTNVGKTSLINCLMGEKIGIVSDKPQTTRFRTSFIESTKEYQIIYVDSPGVHDARNLLHIRLNKKIFDSLDSFEIIVHVINPVTVFDKLDVEIQNKISNKKPRYLVVNKIDLVDTSNLNLDKSITSFYDQVIYTSTKNFFGIKELKKTIINNLNDGPMWYPESMKTDMSKEMLISEIIREKVLNLVRQEVPHGVYVLIEKINEKQNLIFIEANIIVEKESHKPILIGHKGSMIKNIGIESRLEIEKFFGKKCVLKLFVSVEKNWRNKDSLLRRFGLW